MRLVAEIAVLFAFHSGAYARYHEKGEGFYPAEPWAIGFSASFVGAGLQRR